MQWLTTILINFNVRNGVPKFPHVHKFRAGISNKASKDLYGNVQVQHKTDHKWEQWREEERGRMLHLEDKRRLLLGTAVTKYFKFNTE